MQRCSHIFVYVFFLHSYFPVRNSRFPTSICCYQNLQCQRQAWMGLKIKCVRCKTWKWNPLWHHTHNNGPGVKLSWAQPMIHGEDFWEFLGRGLPQSCEQRWRCQCLFPFAYSTNKWMWSLQLYSQGDASECRCAWQSHVNQKPVTPAVHLDFRTVEDTSSLKFLAAFLRINLSNFISPCKIWEGGVVAILPVLNTTSEVVCQTHMSTLSHFILKRLSNIVLLFCCTTVLSFYSPWRCWWLGNSWRGTGLTLPPWISTHTTPGCFC